MSTNYEILDRLYVENTKGITKFWTDFRWKGLRDRLNQQGRRRKIYKMSRWILVRYGEETW